MNLRDVQFCARYPFSPGSRQLLSSQAVDAVPPELMDRAQETAIRWMTSHSFSDEWQRLKDAENESTLMAEVAAYPLAKLMSASTDVPAVKKDFGKGASARTLFFLRRDPDAIARLAGELFEAKKDGLYRLGVYDYLMNIPFGAEFKLVNTELDDGFVHIDDEVMSRVIAEYVYRSIDGMHVDKKSLPRSLLQRADELKRHVAAREEKEIEAGPIDYSAFPPCMRRIYQELRSGAPVAHNSRFVFVTFMANIKVPKKEMVAAFYKTPNFNETKTRYHVEHALGEQGGIKYSCPACAKVESYGLCFKYNTCIKRHPVSNYSFNRGKKR